MLTLDEKHKRAARKSGKQTSDWRVMTHWPGDFTDPDKWWPLAIGLTEELAVDHAFKHRAEIEAGNDEELRPPRTVGRYMRIERYRWWKRQWVPVGQQ